MTARKLYVPELSRMTEAEIKRIAVRRLSALTNVASMRLISDLTRIARPTLLRWLDGGDVDFKTAAWFIVCFETDFRILDLADRPPVRGRNRRKATLRNLGE